MTGEPTHTASKERMAPELMLSSERTLQLSITDSKVKWLLHFAFIYFSPLQMKNSTRSVSAINPVAPENTGDSTITTLIRCQVMLGWTHQLVS